MTFSFWSCIIHSFDSALIQLWFSFDSFLLIFEFCQSHGTALEPASSGKMQRGRLSRVSERSVSSWVLVSCTLNSFCAFEETEAWELQLLVTIGESSWTNINPTNPSSLFSKFLHSRFEMCFRSWSRESMKKPFKPSSQHMTWIHGLERREIARERERERKREREREGERERESIGQHRFSTDSTDFNRF